MTTTAYPKHARLTRSILTSKTLTKAARIILEVLYYHLRVGKPTVVSNRKIAGWAGVSEGTVSLLMPVLAAEPDNRYGNQVPYVTREWDATIRRYVTTLLPQPEVRGWLIAPTPVTPPPPPEPEVVVLADQLSFFDLLPGSTDDRHSAIQPQPITTPQTRIERGSTIESPFLIDHVSVLLANSSSTPSAEKVNFLAERGIFPSLAVKILAHNPDLTPQAFDDFVQLLARRGCYDRPVLVAAKILARGEAIVAQEEPNGTHQPRRPAAQPVGSRSGRAATPTPRIAGPQAGDTGEWEAPTDPAFIARARERKARYERLGM